MTLVTVAIPSPLIRTTLPGVARAMPRHPVQQVIASTTGRAAEGGAATGGTGACVGAAPPVAAGAWAIAALGSRTASRSAAMTTHRWAAARGTGGRAGRSTVRLAAYGVS